MPELPEVETVRRGLEPAMEGQRFTKVEVRRGDLRWPLPKDFAQRLNGRTVTGIGRRAKYLLADLSSGDVLLMHLGMSGSFHVFREKDRQLGRYHHQREKHVAHDHIVFHMSSGATVTFNDPRRFGSMKLVPRAKLDDEPLLKGLGPEPLGNAFDAAMLARACRGKKTSLKAALLDQRIVAGLGNIYVCEALYRARLSPKRMASTIAGRKGEPNERAKRLVEAIKAVLNEAIKSGGSSLRDHRRTNGDLGMFQHNFRVYDREGEPCAPPYPPPLAGEGREGACGGTVKRIVQNGRSTFYCPACQQ
ncbi:MAG: bifunctional DNA-formamidopyrimidine glycosylase/DNA-(apurinic or apyrimidinic site) lyase [Xanthobacteraceae bacterium]